MFFRKLRGILVPAFLLLLLIIASVLLLNTLLQVPSVQRYLLAHLSNAIGYELQTGTINVSLWRGVGISAHEVEAKSRTGPEKIVAARIEVTLDTRELLMRRIVPTSVFLFRPQIEIAVKRGWRPSKLKGGTALKEILLQRLGGLAAVSMEKGRVSLKNISLELRDLDFHVSQEDGDPLTHEVNLRGKVVFRKENVDLALRGTITQDTKTNGDLFAEVILKAGRVPLTWVPWPASVELKKGHAEVIAKLKGRLGGPVSAEGKISSGDLGFTLIKGQARKDFSFSQLTLDFESLYAQSSLKISAFSLKAPDFSLTGHSTLDLQERSNPSLVLHVESPYMTLQTFKRIFPTQLLPRWSEKRLLPVLAGGAVRVDVFSLDGTLKQIRNLARPQNGRTLSMRLAWKDLEVLRDDAPLPFEGVSGTLDITNGSLLIEGVKADFGKSTVKTASLRITNLFRGSAGYEIHVDGSFDLEDLLRQRDMGLIPVTVREQLQKFESASGNLEARVHVARKKDLNYPRLQKGEFLFKDCLIVNPDLFFPLLLGEAHIEVDEKGRSQFGGTGLWGKSLFETTGSAEGAFENIKARIAARGDMNEIIARFLHKEPPLVKFSDLVSCEFTLAKDKSGWSFQGELEPRGLVIDTAHLSMAPQGTGGKIQFDARLQPGKRLQLTRVRGIFGNSSFTLGGSLDLNHGGPAHVKLASPGLLLEDLGIRFKKGVSQVKGVLICDTEIRTSWGNPLMTGINGRVEAKDLALVVHGIPSPIRDSFFTLTLSGKEITIQSLKMKVGESSLSIKGDLRGWEGVKGRLAVSADYLNLSDFLSVAEKSNPIHAGKRTEISRFLSRTDVSLTLRAAQGRWRGLAHGPLKAKGAFRYGDIYIERSRVQTAHGVMRAEGHVKRGKEPETLLSGRIRLTAQPVQELAKLLGLKDTYVEGEATMEAVLSTKGRRAQDLIPGLSGSAHFIVEKGTISKSKVIFKVLDFLSLQKIFKQKLPDVSKEGLYFDTIGGNVAITNGILTTENLIMKSPVFNAAAQGTVDLSKKRVDLDLGAHPLGTIDFLVSKIPIVGYILTGKKKALLVYYFRVEGPLSKPEVRYVPLKNLGGSVMGFIKRVFFTPERILEELAKITNALSAKPSPAPGDDF